MRSMISHTKAAMERAMKVQEVILRAIAKRMTWWQAAEIIGISDRQMRRWHRRYEKFGYGGVLGRGRGRPPLRRGPTGPTQGGAARGPGEDVFFFPPPSSTRTRRPPRTGPPLH